MIQQNRSEHHQTKLLLRLHFFFFEQNYGCKKSKKTQSVDSPLWPMWALLGRVSLLCTFLKPFVTPPNLCPPWRWAAGGGQRPVGGGDPIPQFLPLCHPLLARIGAELRRPDAVLAPSASTGRLHGLYQFQYNVAGSNDNPLLAGDVRGGVRAARTHRRSGCPPRARRWVRRPTQQASTSSG